MRVRRTLVFDRWLRKLKDVHAAARIFDRLDRLEKGNPGDWKSVGGGILELRIPYGPGYRVYYTQQGDQLVLILCGGDKGSQARDIERAREIAANLQEEDLAP